MYRARQLLPPSMGLTMTRNGVFAKLIAGCLFMLVAACAGTGAVAPPGDRAGGLAGETSEIYRLGVGDKVRMTVYEEPGLSGEFALGSSGTISIPLIGEVQASGRTVEEVAQTIEARLADGYLREPRVSMEIVTYRPYYILGEVVTPGTYPYVTGLTVVNAIATAEGYTPRANRDVVYIRRLGEQEEVAYRITADLRIFPGDTIRLGERFF